mgnify:CR=1 FL=1
MSSFFFLTTTVVVVVHLMLMPLISQMYCCCCSMMAIQWSNGQLLFCLNDDDDDEQSVNVLNKLRFTCILVFFLGSRLEIKIFSKKKIVCKSCSCYLNIICCSHFLFIVIDVVNNNNNNNDQKPGWRWFRIFNNRKKIQLPCFSSFSTTRSFPNPEWMLLLMNLKTDQQQQNEQRTISFFYILATIFGYSKKFGSNFRANSFSMTKT